MTSIAAEKVGDAVTRRKNAYEVRDAAFLRANAADGAWRRTPESLSARQLKEATAKAYTAACQACHRANLAVLVAKKQAEHQ